MSGEIFAGFVKGASDFGLDAIKARQEEAAVKRKAEMLEKLRRETEEQMLILKDSMDRKKPDKDFTEADYASGERIMRNSYGEEIGRTSLPKSALEDRRLALEDARLDIENTRSTIASRNKDDARQERYTSAAIANMKAGNVNEDDVAVAQYERTFEELGEMINPAALARGRQAFWDGVNNKGWTKAQQRRFLDEYYRRAVVENPRGKDRRPLSQTHNKDTAQLFDLD